ncbi:MAG: hypothetical protein V5A43_09995 [Haloarculaceae archaeon]
MPIDTDAAAWREGEAVERIHEQVMDFLGDHPDQAFTERDIADAVLDTDWETAHERERLRQEIGEEAYEERGREGDLPGADRQPLADSINTVYVGLALSRLLDLDLIEWRAVDAEALGLPYDWDEVEVYTAK